MKPHGKASAQHTRTKQLVVYPTDSPKQCCDVFLAEVTLENVSDQCRGERPPDALRVCHSNSPVSVAQLQRSRSHKTSGCSGAGLLCDTTGQ